MRPSNKLCMPVLIIVLQCLLKSSSSEPLPKPESIVGGAKCKNANFPYVVSIKIGFQMMHFCGGSLIDGYNVLTAGHCGDHISLQVFVVTGQYDFMKVNPEDLQMSPVTHVFKHPEYALQGENPINDIAILRLKLCILETNITKYVKLPPPRSSVPCQVFDMGGWGRYGKSMSGSSVLLCTRIPHISRGECQKLYQGKNLMNTVCSLDKHGTKGVCHGDSGSPIMCGEEQRGLVSWGVQCWGREYPGVHTDVSKYVDFIHTSIHANMVSKTHPAQLNVAIIICLVTMFTG